MDIAITLHRDDLTRAIRDFLPMRLLIGSLAENDDPPWVQINRVEEAEFMPGHGLRVDCGARIHFPLSVLPDDFSVQHVVFEMVPAILAGPNGPVLAFQLHVHDFELKYLPEFVDRAVLKRLNAALVEHASAIAWNFGKALTRLITLPVRLQIVRTLELSAPAGSVEVTADCIVLRLAFDVSFQHAPEPEKDVITSAEAVSEVSTPFTPDQVAPESHHQSWLRDGA